MGYMSAYCDRCERSFPHERALGQHLNDSHAHWECEKCYFDGCSRDDLVEHYDNEGCMWVCEGCEDADENGIFYPQSDEYWEHVRHDNVCTECDRHFDSNSDLEHHKLTHRQAWCECYACTRQFTTFGGMIIHVEAGNCNVDKEDLYRTAAYCQAWNGFIVNSHVLYAMQSEWENLGEDNPFKCPSCCKRFPKLSSLFMHAEDTAKNCNQGLQKGSIMKLKNYLHSELME